MALPPILDPLGSRVASSGGPSHCTESRETPKQRLPRAGSRTPDIQVPSASSLKEPRARDITPATLEGELLASQFEEFRIPDRRFRPGVPRNLSPRLPGWKNLGDGLQAPQPVCFGYKCPLLQGHPGIWASPALQPGGGLIPAPSVRGTQESVPSTGLSRSLRNLGP